MEVRANAVYTGNLKAGSRMFFFDVRKASSNNNYLIISETSKDKEGNKKRTSLMIFNDQFDAFLNELSKTKEFFINKE